MDLIMLRTIRLVILGITSALVCLVASSSPGKQVCLLACSRMRECWKFAYLLLLVQFRFCNVKLISVPFRNNLSSNESDISFNELLVRCSIRASAKFWHIMTINPYPAVDWAWRWEAFMPIKTTFKGQNIFNSTKLFAFKSNSSVIN